MKILFIVPYPFDCVPGQRLKFEQYLSHFKKNGIGFDFCPFVSPRFYKILYKEGRYLEKITYTIAGYFYRLENMWRARKFDIIYIYLNASPLGPPVFEYILKIMGKPLIYDFDDTIYLPHTSKANKIIKFLKCFWKFHRIIKLSDRVIVVTKYLQEYVKKYNKNVVLIPPTVDTQRYVFKDFNVSGISRKVCVGWSGSHSTSGYLYMLENVLRKIKTKYDIKIKIIGNRNFRIPGLDIEAQDWRLNSEVSDLSEIDIGLYPLPKNTWVLGKGGGKAFQYMSMGIPPVCTPFGEAIDFIEEGKNGFFADSEEEWIKKISILIESAELRKKIGINGRQTVEQRYSVNAYADKYIELIKGLYQEKK